MQLSRLCRIIIQRGGKQEWVELSETKLPHGFKTFDYRPKYYAAIIAASGVCCYIYAHSIINPKSKLASVWNWLSGIGTNPNQAIEDVTQSRFSIFEAKNSERDKAANKAQ